MTAESSPFALQSRWVFPVVSEPIPNGYVTIQGERIVAVGSSASCPIVRNLGNMAILPGLVNAHTHLEFSDVNRPLGTAGMAFPDWIRQVVSLRREQASAPGDPPSMRTAAVAKGLCECLSAGTAILGEIASPGWSGRCYQGSRLRSVVFQELLGLKEDRAEPLLGLARDHATSTERLGDHCSRGLSPHAPYTVRLETVSRICQIARRRSAPVAMHLAESPQEIQLLESGGGPFADLLKDLDAWDATAFPGGTRPMDYLRLLERVPRSLAIHGNYLVDEEIDFLGTHRDRMSVVYCPRTHDYFDHAEYPLRKMLDAGVNLCLGTDSRASNPDLSVWEEMRFILRSHPNVSPREVLRMGTSNGATALGLGRDGGILQPRRHADLTFVQLPEASACAPLDALFDDGSSVSGSYIGGCRHEPPG